MAPPLPEASQPSNTTHTAGPRGPSPSRPAFTSRRCNSRRWAAAMRCSSLRLRQAQRQVEAVEALHGPHSSTRRFAEGRAAGVPSRASIGGSPWSLPKEIGSHHTMWFTVGDHQPVAVRYAVDNDEVVCFGDKGLGDLVEGSTVVGTVHDIAGGPPLRGDVVRRAGADLGRRRPRHHRRGRRPRQPDRDLGRGPAGASPARPSASRFAAGRLNLCEPLLPRGERPAPGGPHILRRAFVTRPRERAAALGRRNSHCRHRGHGGGGAGVSPALAQPAAPHAPS